MPVPWSGRLSRSVVLLGWWGVLPFRLTARFLSVRGAGRFGWFFHMELSGGLFEEEWVACLRRDERSECGNASGVYLFPWGVLLGLDCFIYGLPLFYLLRSPLASCDGVGVDVCGGE